MHSVRVSEPPRDPFREAEGAPYWRRHYGIGHAWAPTARGRRGCILMLVIALATFVLVGIVAGIVYILR